MEKKLLLVSLFCALSFSALAADVYLPPKRWRGFNLMEMFIKDSGMLPGHFVEQDFQMISELVDRQMLNLLQHY